MRRLFVLGGLMLLIPIAGGATATARTAASSAAPACPDLEAWTLTKGNGPYPAGGGSTELQCDYNQPGITDTATITGDWVGNSAGSQAYTTFACKPAPPATGSYYKVMIDDGYWAEIELHVGGGASSAEVVQVYQGNLARLEKSALALFSGIEQVARRCPGVAVTTTTPATGGKMLETDTVPATIASIVTRHTFAGAHTYRFVVSGTVGVHRGVKNENDLFYCFRKTDLNGDGKPDCSPPAFFNMLCVGTKSVPLDIYHCVGLDKLARHEGKIAYSPGHTYSLTINGISGRLTLGIRAASLADASGHWLIKIYDLG